MKQPKKGGGSVMAGMVKQLVWWAFNILNKTASCKGFETSEGVILAEFYCMLFINIVRHLVEDRARGIKRKLEPKQKNVHFYRCFLQKAV